MFVLGGRVITHNQFTLIMCGITFVLFASICYLVMRRFITHHSKKDMKAMEKLVNNITYEGDATKRSLESKRKAIKLAKLFKSLKIFYVSEEKQQQITELLDKVGEENEDGTRMEFVDIYCKCCIQAITYSVPFMVGALFFKPLMIGVVLGVYKFNAPIARIKALYTDDLALIDEQMPTFISTFYYKYKNKGSSLDIKGLADDFMLIANPALANLLSGLREDTEDLGDISALHKTRDRYRDSHYVYQFCTIAEGIWNKQDNAYVQLHNFHEELKQKRITSRNAQAEERLDKAKKATNGLYALLVIMATVYLYVIVVQKAF